MAVSRGELVATRYELHERLGAGGVAVVHRARDLRLDRDVALKVLRGEYATDEEFLARFQREARIAAGLNHPNIVRVDDYGTHGDTYFIAMELVEGANLKEHVRVRGSLAPSEAVGIARQVLSALAAAHSQGLVHRDVKPQNVLISREGAVKLTDFGIAHNAAAATQLTQMGATIGTAAYIAPEQASGSLVGPAADIYGVGLLLYEMLTGRPAFEGETPASVLYRQVNVMPQPPRELKSEIPPQLETVVMKALEKDPANRFPSAAAMLDALPESFAGPVAPPIANTMELPVVPPPVVPPPSPAPPAPTRRTELTDLGPRPTRWLAPVLIAGLVALLAFAAWRLLTSGVPSPLPTDQPPVATAGPRATQTAAAATGAATGAPTTAPTVASSPTTATGAAPAGQPTAAPSPTTVAPSPTAPAPTATTASGTKPGGQTAPTATAAAPTATTAPATATPRAQAPTATAPAAPTATNAGAATKPVAAGAASAGSKPVASDPSDVVLDDTAWSGGYRNEGNSVYRQRTATWVYGAGTPYSTMTASFDLPSAPTGQVSLLIVGLDSEDQGKTPIQVLVNDREIFRGPAPFESDNPNNSDFVNGAAPWTERGWRMPASLYRQGPNTITIRNLAPGGTVGQVPFFMIDRARVVFAD